MSNEMAIRQVLSSDDEQAILKREEMVNNPDYMAPRQIYDFVCNVLNVHGQNGCSTLGVAPEPKDCRHCTLPDQLEAYLKKRAKDQFQENPIVVETTVRCGTIHVDITRGY